MQSLRKQSPVIGANPVFNPMGIRPMETNFAPAVFQGDTLLNSMYRSGSGAATPTATFQQQAQQEAEQVQSLMTEITKLRAELDAPSKWRQVWFTPSNSIRAGWRWMTIYECNKVMGAAMEVQMNTSVDVEQSWTLSERHANSTFSLQVCWGWLIKFTWCGETKKMENEGLGLKVSSFTRELFKYSVSMHLGFSTAALSSFFQIDI